MTSKANASIKVARATGRRFFAALPLAFGVFVAVGCGDHKHDHDGKGDHAGDHGDHEGHGGGEEELPAIAVTEWTEKSELFMEYSPFIVGAESRFLAHVTDLKDFKALLEGEVSVIVTMADGESVSVADSMTAKGPTRPGIFIPTFTPKRAGACTIALDIRSPAVTDRIEAGECDIYADEAAARTALGKEEEGKSEISFLKEQQWVIDFATSAVTKRELADGVRVNAEIRPVPSREARLTASTDGRFVLATPVPIIGQAVKKGQRLGSIQPTAAASGNYGSLRADVDASDASLAAAISQRDRLARLVATDAVPKRRLEDAEAVVKVAQARKRASATRLSSYNASAAGSATVSAGAFRLRAPISGTLVEARASSGQTVSAGDPLFTVIDLDRVWVTGRVFEADLPKLDNAAGAWFQLEGRPDVFEIGEGTGRLVTVGSVIDAKTRTVPIIYEVGNTARVQRIGQFATLTVATGPAASVVAVPESALLSEGGQWIAYVQTSGESFARRVVSIGIRSRGYAEVRSGLSEGEHVVTIGAYDIKLAASAGGAPAHGHAH